MKGFDIFHLGSHLIFTNTRIASTRYRHFYQSLFPTQYNKSVYTTRAIPYVYGDSLKLNYFNSKELFLSKKIEKDINSLPIFIILRNPYQRLLSSIAHFILVIVPQKYKKELDEFYDLNPLLIDRTKELLGKVRKEIYNSSLSRDNYIFQYQKELFRIVDYFIKCLGEKKVLDDIHFTKHNEEAFHLILNVNSKLKNLFLTDIENLGGKYINSSYIISYSIEEIFSTNYYPVIMRYLKQEQSYYNRLKTEYEFLNLNYEQTRIIRTN